MRLILSATLLALAACDAPATATDCCAVEPMARCESMLEGMGVSAAEQAVLKGPRPVCPSDVISADRIRELDSHWPQACRAAGMRTPQDDSGRC